VWHEANGRLTAEIVLGEVELHLEGCDEAAAGRSEPAQTTELDGREYLVLAYAV
jgi:hypothetical protein